MKAATDIGIMSIGLDLLTPNKDIVAVMVTFRSELCGDDIGWITFRDGSIKVCGRDVTEPHRELRLFSEEDAAVIVEALGCTEVGRKVVSDNDLTITDLTVEIL